MRMVVAGLFGVWFVCSISATKPLQTATVARIGGLPACDVSASTAVRGRYIG